MVSQSHQLLLEKEYLRDTIFFELAYLKINCFTLTLDKYLVKWVILSGLNYFQRLHCITTSSVSTGKYKCIFILIFFMLHVFFFFPFWKFLLSFKNSNSEISQWCPLFLVFFIHCARCLMGWFNSKPHVWHFGKIVLNYFFDIFIFCIFSALSRLFGCWISCSNPLTKKTTFLSCIALSSCSNSWDISSAHLPIHSCYLFKF